MAEIEDEGMITIARRNVQQWVWHWVWHCSVCKVDQRAWSEELIRRWADAHVNHFHKGDSA